MFETSTQVQERQGMNARLLALLLFLSFGASMAAAQESDWDARREKAFKAFQQGRHDETVRLLQACLKEAEAFPATDPRLAQTLLDLATVHKSRRRYAEALPLLKRALEIRTKRNGPDSLPVARALRAMAGLHHDQDHLKKAEELYLRALPMLKKALGPKHNEVLRTINDLAVLYDSLGQYKKAEPLLKQGLAAAEEVSGKESPEVATSLNNLGSFYFAIGRYAQARPLLERSLRLFEKHLGSDHPSLAILLVNLTHLCRRLGRFEQAEANCRRALGIREKKLGAGHPDTAETVNVLGQIREVRGRPEEAERLYRDALTRLEKVLGPDHGRLAGVINNLAILQDRMARSDRAEKLFKRALAIDKKVRGGRHPARAKTLNALATLYLKQKRDDEAEVLIREALTIQEEALGADHPDLGVSLSGLARILKNRGKLKESESILRRALRIEEKALGVAHPSVAKALNNLATVVGHRGRLEEAQGLFERAVRILRATFEPTYPDTLHYAINHALLLAEMGKTDKAVRTLDAGIRGMAKLRESVFAMGSERDKMLWVKANAGRWEVFFALAWLCHKEVSEAPGLALDAALAYKGAVLRAVTFEHQAARLEGDPRLAKLAREVVDARRKLASLMLQNQPQQQPADRRRQIEQWEKDLDRLEADLARQSLPFARRRAGRRANGKAVAAALPTNAAFVSFVRYADYDFKRRVDKPPRYLAIVVGKDEAPGMYDLGPAREMDRAVADLHRAGSEAVRRVAGKGESAAERALADHARALSSKVLAPLWDKLKDRARWVLSPDGSLHLLPFCMLPIPGGKGQVIDRHEVTYVTNGTEVLAFGSKRPAGKEALVLADPDFDGAVASTRSEGVKSLARSADFSVGGWSRLPGTLREAQAIGRLLKEKKIPMALKHGPAAHKYALFAARSPRILHLATHGFYLPDQPLDPIKATGNEGWRGLAGVAPSMIPSSAVPENWRKMENPLLRSGLVLAGANRKDGQLHGVATAQELLGLDLWKTDLVVLSACETGIGEVANGEGVLGLRRSFLHSGAKALVTSLWKIPDRETTELMAEFYRRVLAGERPGAALRAAQLAVRDARKKKHGAVHPFYWASFVLVGDPD